MTLVPGSRLGHLRIEALLGEGGMGEVYRAFDERLERQVAVKAIRDERRWTSEARTRFLREARILSKLDHPHICRIYDLVQSAESDYLLLEYVEGKTLREAMRAGLPHEAKLRIAEQVAEALAAAHRLEIVHRDLKPENIMVTAAGEAKILDFGIARSARPGEAEPTEATGRLTLSEDAAALPRTVAFGAPGTAPLTGETFHTSRGSLLGTLTYMSPEQARGEALTEASDLYSFGIVLHELFSGQPAYPPGKLIETLQRVASARVLPVEGVDADLAQLIVELEALAATTRPSAAQVRDRLRSIRDKPLRRRRRWLAAGAAIGVALLVAAAALLSYRLTRPPALLAPGERARVALLPFRNATGERSQDWVGTGLAEMVAEGLDAAPGIDVLPLAEVREVRKQLAISDSTPLRDEDAARLHGALGDNLLVETAAYRLDDGAFELRYALRSPGRAVARKTVRAADLGDAANRLTAGLTLWLRPEAQAVDLKASFSADPFANRAYAIGLERRDTAGAKAARAYFDVALDRDPEFLWARYRLAENLGESGSPEESAALFAAVLEAARQRQDARLEASTLLRIGTQASDRGDFAGSEVILRQALDASQKLGDAYTIAEITNNLATNAYYRDDRALAERLWNDALEQSRRLGYKKREVGTLNNLAALAYDRGDLDRAQELWERGVADAEALGHRTLRARLVSNLGLIDNDRRHPEAAEPRFREALATYRETGYRKSMPVALYNLGETMSILGRYGEAESAVREGLGIAEELKDEVLRVRLLAALAMLLSRRGADDEARRTLEAAQAASEAMATPEELGETAKVWAYYHLRQARRREAEPYLRRAEQWKAEDSETRMLRARAVYLDGRLDEALRLAQAAKAMRDTWTRAMEEELAVYVRAAELGRRVPFADEPQR
jgi:tRNA A-37 threonylcarbamoyl transferase component Bud32